MAEQRVSLSNISTELDDIKKKLEEVSGVKFDNLSTIKDELKEAEDAMQKIIAATGKESEESKKAIAIVAKLKQEYQAINKTVDASIKSNPFQTFQRGATLAINSIQLLQASMNLFGVESQDAAQAIMKLQSIMAISSTIQQVGAMAKSMGLFTTATNVANVATKAFNATLLANPYVAIAAAIVGIGTALYFFGKGSDEATEKTKTFSEELDETTKSVYDNSQEIVKNLMFLDRLKAAGGVTTLSIGEQKEALDRINKSLDDTSVQYDTLEQAMADYPRMARIIIKNKAAETLATKYYTDYLRYQIELQDYLAKSGTGSMTTSDFQRIDREEERLRNAMAEAKRNFEAASDMIVDLGKKTITAGKSQKDFNKTVKEGTDEYKKLNEEVNKMQKSVSELAKEYDDLALTDVEDRLQSELKALDERYRTEVRNVNDINNKIRKFNAENKKNIQINLIDISNLNKKYESERVRIILNNNDIIKKSLEDLSNSFRGDIASNELEKFFEEQEKYINSIYSTIFRNKETADKYTKDVLNSMEGFYSVENSYLERRNKIIERWNITADSMFGDMLNDLVNESIDSSTVLENDFQNKLIGIATFSKNTSSSLVSDAKDAVKKWADSLSEFDEQGKRIKFNIGEYGSEEFNKNIDSLKNLMKKYGITAEEIDRIVKLVVQSYANLADSNIKIENQVKRIGKEIERTLDIMRKDNAIEEFYQRLDKAQSGYYKRTKEGEYELLDTKRKSLKNQKVIARQVRDETLAFDEYMKNQSILSTENEKQSVLEQLKQLEAYEISVADTEAEKEEIRNKYRNRELEAINTFNEKIEKIEKGHADKKVKTEQQYLKTSREITLARVNMVGQSLSEIGNLTENLGEAFVKDELKQKNVKIAATTITTIGGAASAFANTAGTIPQPLGFILGGIAAASILASGYAQIRKMEQIPIDGKTGGGQALPSAQSSFVPPSILNQLGEQNVRVINDDTNIVEVSITDREIQRNDQRREFNRNLGSF